MKNTRKNISELLKAMELNAYKMVIHFKEQGNQTQEEEYIGKARGFLIARLILESEKQYNDFYEIYKKYLEK